MDARKTSLTVWVFLLFVLGLPAVALGGSDSPAARADAGVRFVIHIPEELYMRIDAPNMMRQPSKSLPLTVTRATGNLRGITYFGNAQNGPTMVSTGTRTAAQHNDRQIVYTLCSP